MENGRAARNTIEETLQNDSSIGYPLRHTRAIVDLDALRYNLDLIAAAVPGSGLAPAVKADGYGHGAVAIASECEGWGATMLAVANVQEYLYLRDYHITVPILILEELFEDEIEVALREGARLTVGSVAYARTIGETAARLGTTAMFHVNLDTGMGRMGLHPFRDASEEVTTALVDALLEIASVPAATMEGVYTHFPGSDESDTSFPHEQIAIANGVVQGLAERNVTVRYKHIANSGALLQFPEDVSWDLVRPGVAMYGMYPSEEVGRAIGLRPVMRLESRIVKITRYHRDWTVGYGRTWEVSEGAVVGIIPIGYGDGYPRVLSSRGSVLVHGMRVPIAGRVSMDMIAVDLTHVPEVVEVGDEAVLLGRQDWIPRERNVAARSDAIDATELAQLCDTITYEITCGFTARIPRVYTRGGTPIAIQTMRDGYKRL